MNKTRSFTETLKSFGPLLKILIKTSSRVTNKMCLIRLLKKESSRQPLDILLFTELT